MPKFGKSPRVVGHFPLNLSEVMYYLYLPVRMDEDTNPPEVRLPMNLMVIKPMIIAAGHDVLFFRQDPPFKYIYVSARKGWATPDNPLNRPGWHADGFGTDDLNYVWWTGPGTRFAVQHFENISEDHVEFLKQFEQQINPERVIDNLPEKVLYCITPEVVHATPLIKEGCWRQYVKISFSNHRYNLENNSHNYAFNYKWELHGREAVRNDTDKAQRDFA